MPSAAKGVGKAAGAAAKGAEAAVGAGAIGAAEAGVDFGIGGAIAGAEGAADIGAAAGAAGAFGAEAGADVGLGAFASGGGEFAGAGEPFFEGETFGLGGGEFGAQQGVLSGALDPAGFGTFEEGFTGGVNLSGGFATPGDFGGTLFGDALNTPLQGGFFQGIPSPTVELQAAEQAGFVPGTLNQGFTGIQSIEAGFTPAADSPFGISGVPESVLNTPSFQSEVGFAQSQLEAGVPGSQIAANVGDQALAVAEQGLAAQAAPAAGEIGAEAGAAAGEAGAAAGEAGGLGAEAGAAGAEVGTEVSAGVGSIPAAAGDTLSGVGTFGLEGGALSPEAASGIGAADIAGTAPEIQPITGGLAGTSTGATGGFVAPTAALESPGIGAVTGPAELGTAESGLGGVATGGVGEEFGGAGLAEGPGIGGGGASAGGTGIGEAGSAFSGAEAAAPAADLGAAAPAEAAGAEAAVAPEVGVTGDIGVAGEVPGISAENAAFSISPDATSAIEGTQVASIGETPALEAPITGSTDLSIAAPVENVDFADLAGEDILPEGAQPTGANAFTTGGAQPIQVSADPLGQGILTPQTVPFQTLQPGEFGTAVPFEGAPGLPGGGGIPGINVEPIGGVPFTPAQGFPAEGLPGGGFESIPTGGAAPVASAPAAGAPAAAGATPAAASGVGAAAGAPATAAAATPGLASPMGAAAASGAAAAATAEGVRSIGQGQQATVSEILQQPGRGSAPFSNAGVNNAIISASRATGISTSLLNRIARIESGGNPRAVTGSNNGLFQLSTDIFNQYGGSGDVFDPNQNAMAAARELQAFQRQFTQANGRAATDAELYMMHQQGVAGSQALAANPNETAWQAIRQFYPSARIAQQAIWGNVPDQLKAQFGSVDNITSSQFTRMWARIIGPGTSQVAQPGGETPGGDAGAPTSALPNQGGGIGGEINAPTALPPRSEIEIPEGVSGVGSDFAGSPSQISPSPSGQITGLSLQDALNAGGGVGGEILAPSGELSIPNSWQQFAAMNFPPGEGTFGFTPGQVDELMAGAPGEQLSLGEGTFPQPTTPVETADLGPASAQEDLAPSVLNQPDQIAPGPQEAAQTPVEPATPEAEPPSPPETATATTTPPAENVPLPQPRPDLANPTFMSWWKGLNPFLRQAIVSVPSLGLAAYRLAQSNAGSAQLRQQLNALQQQAVLAGSQGANLQAQVNAGQIPAADEAIISKWLRDMLNQVRQQFANQGRRTSTEEISAEGAARAAAQEKRAQILDQEQQQALGFTGQAGQDLAAEARLQQAQQSQFNAALNGLFLAGGSLAAREGITALSEFA